MLQYHIENITNDKYGFPENCFSIYIHRYEKMMYNIQQWANNCFQTNDFKWEELTFNIEAVAVCIYMNLT